MKNPLTELEKQRIRFYEYSIGVIENNPDKMLWICKFAEECCVEIPEYLLFREEYLEYVSSWLGYQVANELITFEVIHINEYRVFILQLCIEMIKNK